MNFPAEGSAGWFDWIPLVRHLRRAQVIDERIDSNPLLAGTPLYVEAYHPTYRRLPGKS